MSQINGVVFECRRNWHRRSSQLVRAAALSILLSPFVLGACSGRAPDNLGIKSNMLAPCPKSPNCVSSRSEDEEHRVEPFALSSSPEISWSRLKEVVQAQPRAEIVQKTDNYLHAEFRSRWFRFVDDVEFYLDPDQKVIHLRSASRIGYSDLGANRKRVEALRAAFGNAMK